MLVILSPSVTKTVKKEEYRALEKTKKRLNTQGRASIWYISSNFISKIIAFAFTPVFTRILSESEYGLYSLYVSWLGIFTVISTLEMHGNIAYRALLSFNDKKSFIPTAVLASGTLILTELIIYIIFRDSFNAITGLTTPITVIMLLQIFLNAAEGFIFAKKRFSYNYTSVSLLNIAMGITTPIIALILISFFRLYSLGRIIAPFIVSLVFIIPHLLPLIKKGHFFDKKIYKTLFGMGFPMLPHFITLSLIANGDKIVISHLLGEGAVGAYAVAYSAAYILMPLTQGAASSLSPWLTQHSDRRFKEEMQRSFGYTLTIAFLFLSVFLTAAPEIFAFIGGERFEGGLSSVYPLSISVIFLFLANLISSVTICYSRRDVVLSTFAAFTFGAVFIMPLIMRFGILGGAIATLISYLVLFFANLLFSYRRLGFLITEPQSFVFSLLCLSLFASLALFLRHSLAARLILLSGEICYLIYILKRGRAENFKA